MSETNESSQVNEATIKVEVSENSIGDKIAKIAESPSFKDKIDDKGRLNFIDSNKAAREASQVLRDEGLTPFSDQGLEGLKDLYRNEYTDYKKWSRDNNINTVGNSTVLTHEEGRRFRLVDNAIKVVDGNSQSWKTEINQEVSEELDK